MTSHKHTGEELHTQIQYRLIEELAASEARYRQLVENLNEIVFEIDRQGCLIFLNRVWQKTLGYEIGVAKKFALEDFFCPEDRLIGQILIERILHEKTAIKEELRFRHRDGHIVWLEISARPNGKGGASGVLMDISDRKQATAQLQYLAYHDALTGLPNRLSFVKSLEAAIVKVQNNTNSHFAVLFLDLDGFKLVNDSLGHLAGDRLLIAVAQRLQRCLLNQGIVSRFGGDEFNILLEEINHKDEAIHYANHIRKILNQPFDLEGYRMCVSTSIGIVISPFNSIQPDRLLQDADIALYQAKLSGKATYAIFDRKMREQAVERLQLEIDLRQGLERQEFEVYYQPIVRTDARTGINRLKGFEALVRWHHPQRGCVLPSCFIPMAEETGLILELGWWVLHQACDQLVQWQKKWQKSPSLTMNVNLSSKQFLQSDLLENIDRILRETSLERQYLNLEITESTIMNNTEATRSKLKQLKSSGINLSIDDFGIGYSSLSYLHRFPINTLKIDRSFVCDLNEKGENREIIETIIILARKLGLDIIAEGVEKQVQLQQLCLLGCEQFQGYLFSRPLTAERVESNVFSPQTRRSQTDNHQATQNLSVLLF
ncbi:MAG: EAL domain-containing protein [Cyanobacteria bacterium P01_G01_bin.54]